MTLTTRKKKHCVHIITFGCSANTSSSEIMAGLLREAGFSIVDAAGRADIIVVNTCTVKQRTENRVAALIKRLSGINKMLIVAGCMPEVQAGLIRSIAPRAALLGTHHVRDIARLATRLIADENHNPADGGNSSLTGRRHESKLQLPKIRKNTAIAIVQISQGCLGECSYCIVRLARGRLHSYPIKDIVAEVKTALSEGCREIWLTSQDCAAYGIDTGTDLAELLRAVTAVRGSFRVRIGMMNPSTLKPIAGKLIRAYRSRKAFRFIHIPVQAGNNRILKAMNRQYTAAGFKQLVNKFRMSFPMITLSTDIICGFPGEDNAEFGDSLELVKETRPDIVNISRFWPRPGTRAEEMYREHKIEGNITKKRSQELSGLVRGIALENNRRWLGKSCVVLVDEHGKGAWVGRNIAYKPVVIRRHSKLKPGDFCRVKIAGAKGRYLEA
ncbi:threonylcarbamoyladenosine tRNA methylthiotransferase [Candidatus Woesearchaeota archaeon CG08_land_8_20_14_0_20_47_9]|nr:MAG: hypothetical protein AUJ69_03085 [Candidatus Woesearchaeota archaeon CG1_02_47_18]PIO03074.1 MAG: threonylcarbamoyladenosine tRNA methylthiotransferase [Candidatus Woesearchaeota archaeon CG08_land_8_20_14_0_20_47_9]